MSTPKLEKLINNVKAAVHLFLANDRNLLRLEAHEQSISHRIAVYLEPLFEGLNVDCEYNKHLDCSKKINLSDFNPDSHRGCDCNACKEIVKGKLPSDEKPFRPDILVHHRGNDYNNRIAIEVKKGKECLFDQAKLKALTDNDGDYKYDLGVFVYFPDDRPLCKFFQNGTEVEKK